MDPCSSIDIMATMTREESISFVPWLVSNITDMETAGNIITTGEKCIGSIRSLMLHVPQGWIEPPWSSTFSKLPTMVDEMTSSTHWKPPWPWYCYTMKRVKLSLGSTMTMWSQASLIPWEPPLNSSIFKLPIVVLDETAREPDCIVYPMSMCDRLRCP